MTNKDTDAIRDDIVKSIQTVSKGCAISHDGYIEEYYRGYIDGLDRATEIIDNAPTVEYPFYQEAYQTGYEEGKKDSQTGEWIKDEQGIYRCSKCFHRCMEFVMGKPKDKFCIECGSDMTKGGAE